MLLLGVLASEAQAVRFRSRADAVAIEAVRDAPSFVFRCRRQSGVSHGNLPLRSIALSVAASRDCRHGRRVKLL